MMEAVSRRPEHGIDGVGGGVDIVGQVGVLDTAGVDEVRAELSWEPHGEVAHGAIGALRVDGVTVVAVALAVQVGGAVVVNDAIGVAVSAQAVTARAVALVADVAVRQTGMTTPNAGWPGQLVAAAFDRAGMSVTYGVVLDALVTVLVQGRGEREWRCCRCRLTAAADCVGGKCVRFLNKGRGDGRA